MLTILLFLFLISLCVFLSIMYREPRTLWSGFSFFWVLLFLGLLIIGYLMKYSQWIVEHQGLYLALIILLIIAMILLFMFPVLVILTFFVEGIKLIRHEGFRFSNILSLLFSIGLFVYLFGFPIFFGLQQNPYLTILYGIVSTCVVYGLSVFTIFCFSAMLNLVHFTKRKNLDTIIVLGSGILGKKITPLLKGRVDAGIELLKKNPKAILILSGGQGEGEEIPESKAMYEYCLSKGVDPDRMIQENRSKNTNENLLFSRELLSGQKDRVAIVTTRYHVFRALELARLQNFRCIGFGSKTKWYFTLNAFLREFIGYIAMTWKTQAILLGILLIPWFLTILLTLKK